MMEDVRRRMGEGGNKGWGRRGKGGGGTGGGVREEGRGWRGEGGGVREGGVVYSFQYGFTLQRCKHFLLFPT